MPESRNTAGSSPGVPRSCIFIFVNPKSGGNAAGVLLQGGQESYIIRGNQKDETAELFIFDISCGSRPEKPGFLRLSDLIKRDPSRHYCVIAAGGDGTVMWCLSELEAHQIPLGTITLCVLPFGTGNDFARALGWTLPSSFKPFNNNLSQLRELMDCWLSGLPIYHDIWDVNFWVKPSEGSFLRVSSDNREKREIRDDDNQLMQELQLKMCNYFSLGVESRIGIGFDKHRTESAFANKIKYTTEGLKKALFTPTRSIQETLSELHDENFGTVFSTISKSEPQIANAVSLIAVNIPSFAAGLDVWGNSCQSGIAKHSLESLPFLRFDQRMGDRKLEFVSFPSISAIGAEMTSGGNGKRVHQGFGPFEFRFLGSINPSEKVYFQVDGEFFATRRPDRVRLTHSIRIKVLANSMSSKRRCYVSAPQ